MPNVYEAFETNESLEQEGIVVDYGDFRFTLARAGGSNKKYTALVQKRLRPYRKRILTDAMDSQLAHRILAECFAEAVVLGWEGVTNRAGALLPFSRENCVQLLVDLPELFADLQEQAVGISNFLRVQREEDGKR